MPQKRTMLAEIRQYATRLQTLIDRASELVSTLEGLANQHAALQQHLSDSQAQIDQHVNNSQAQLKQDLANSQAQINQHVNNAAAGAGQVNSHAAETGHIKSQAQQSHSQIEQLATGATEFHSAIAQTNNEIVEQTETLANLTDTASNLEKQVESLLPGATSAGLASAFAIRRKVFERPKVVWVLVLVGALATLFLAALLDPSKPDMSDPTLAGVAGYLLSRLPFALPIVWLALYAGRRHSQALRLEEEYAHKEVLSRSFEGYKKQIAELEEGQDCKEQTLSLIQTTLKALSLHPGRVYQGKRDEGHPLWALLSRRKPDQEDD